MAFTLAKNKEISLVMPDWHDGEEEFFEIILNESNEVVGRVIFRHYNDEIYGNVDYDIFKEYRGNGYAKKALILFKENLYKISDDDIVITVKPNNGAYLKTAIGAGATYMKTVKLSKESFISKNGLYDEADVYEIKMGGKRK